MMRACTACACATVTLYCWASTARLFWKKRCSAPANVRRTVSGAAATAGAAGTWAMAGTIAPTSQPNIQMVNNKNERNI